MYIYIYYIYTVLFEIIVGVLTTCHLGLQMQPHVISFYGIMSGSGLGSSCSRKYPGTEDTNQNRH